VCNSLKNKLEAFLLENFPNISIYSFDTKQNSESSAQMGILSVPAIIVFFDKCEVLRKTRFIFLPELGYDLERLFAVLG